MLFGIPKSARCVQRFDDSLNSAIHITYRISLRSSSMREPRDPLLKVLLDYNKTTFVTTSVYKKGQMGNESPHLTVHRCYGCEGAKALPKRRPTRYSLMILPQVHLRKPCYDFYFL